MASEAASTAGMKDPAEGDVLAGGDGASARAFDRREAGARLFRQGDLLGAAQAFEDAGAMFEAVGELRAQGEAMNDLGVARLRLRQWDGADSAFRRAEGIFRGIGDEAGQARALGNRGELYRRKGRPEEAVGALKSAADLLLHAGEDDDGARTLLRIARIRLGQARWFEFLHFYDLSLACVEHPGVKERILRWLIRIPMGLLSGGSA